MVLLLSNPVLSMLSSASCRSRLVLAALLLGAGSLFAEESAQSQPASELAAPAEAAKKAPRKGLVVGMSAAEVESLIGKPNEIESLATPEGPATVWVYRRSKGVQVENLHMSDKQITAWVQDADGTMKEKVVGTEPIFKQVRRETFEVVRICLFKDRFVNMSKTVETRENF